MSDIFNPPEADLHDPIAAGEYGSIEKAIEGRYSFQIREILSEAWANLKGFKRKILLGIFLYTVVIVAIQLITGFVFSASPLLLFISQQLVQLFVAMPLLGGLYIMCIKRSVGAAVEIGDLFSRFNKVFKLAGTVILMYILIVVGFLLLILPGIYLMIAYAMALPLAVEKDLGIWETLETSRKAVTKNWFKFLGFGLIAMLMFFVAAIPLGIGLIWAGPLLGLSYGILYRNMFGVEPETINE